MSIERLTMQSPAGTLHMVLARDREQFEARGFRYVGPFGSETAETGEQGASPASTPPQAPRTRKRG